MSTLNSHKILNSYKMYKQAKTKDEGIIVLSISHLYMIFKIRNYQLIFHVLVPWFIIHNIKF